MNQLLAQEKIKQFLIEDIGTHDVSANTIFSTEVKGTAQFYAKDNGVVAGIEIIKLTYELIDKNVLVESYKKDGDQIVYGEKIAIVSGPIRAILSGERLILNLLQRMSGIATLTNLAVTTLNSEHTKICDTRKTSPGLRMFEKYAVTCGGGYNHRFGLYDGVMIKDNHIAFCGSITEAVKRVREKVGSMIKIEVETESEAEVIEAVAAGADIIMFDNRSAEEINTLSIHVPENIITEASGGISLSTLASYQNTKVDYISLGFLTHSVKALDISLVIEGVD